MPVVSAEAVVPVDPATAFAVSQTTGAIRRRWDPFISEQHFLDEADAPAKGVRTFTRQRFGFAMVSSYVSYAPPTNVGMVMETGPWFFEKLGGGWRFTAVPEGTLAVWKYNFSSPWPGSHPSPSGSVRGSSASRSGAGFAGFVRGCSDPVVLDAVRR